MDKIVNEALKVDFHIHSYASHVKDKDKVKDGKIENIHILVDKLIEHEINMASITDHDNFDFDLYCKLKEEENKDNCIKKIIPGVEFSVKIEDKTLHIVTLFNDDIEKIKKIQEYIYDVKNERPFYDEDNCFSEKKFIEILNKIDLDTILIAHQKESLSSSKTRKNDANTIGVKKLEDYVFIDYFEAFEFKNKRNEIFNKIYIEKQQNKLKEMNFITGSDCHNWNNYPERDNDGTFEFSFFKCLPSFRGIMMAITDSRRIKIGNNSFFSNNAPVKSIALKIDGEEKNIELSRGINAIIGDNSIGKSLLLHKMTEYRELTKEKTLVAGYEEYLSENKIEINTIIPAYDIRNFDRQGNIRQIFNNNKTGTKDFINQYYPIEPNYRNEKSIIINKIEEFIEYLEQKKKYNEELSKLSNITFELHEELATSMQVTKIELDFKKDETKYINLITEMKEIVLKNNKLLKSDLLSFEEQENIKNYSKYINELITKFEKRLKELELCESKVDLINTIITSFNNELEVTKSEEQKARDTYNLKFKALSTNICNLIRLEENNINYNPKIETIEIKPNSKVIGEYRFICKSSISKFDTNSLIELLKEPLYAKEYKKNLSDLNDIDPTVFMENIKTGEDNPSDILVYYKEKILDKVDKMLKIKKSINNSADTNVTRDLSTGANVSIYFDLLSNDRDNAGVYIIDQPEDDVSQPSIKKKLLKDFKKIAQNRQIILITHNPQFIINLDVDNIIFIGKDETNNKIYIKNGALEYKDSETDILKIVADNIEGGIDSLKERYKKYEKNN